MREREREGGRERGGGRREGGREKEGERERECVHECMGGGRVASQTVNTTVVPYKDLMHQKVIRPS